MKVILDTNVFISGVFFTGPPYQILKAWREGEVKLVVSQEILEEYLRVGETLAAQFSGVELAPILELLTVEAELTLAPSLPEPVCVDPDDDKFLACALASKTKLIISGDKQLLKVSGYRGIEVVRPRKFVDDYLGERRGS
ncbi:MAG: putative toxin-antitoxin system toxin component, PIN family [Deltaproteobacteria bacterium]|nr:putative toxin-antitoxin system toxin component, PIN family [Deltaproteobacteria bacterium]